MASIFDMQGRRVVGFLTNKSGGALAKGDVVIIDSANDEAVTTSTAGAETGIIGVVTEENGIANNAQGRIAFQGYVDLVNVNASVTRGHFGKTHTVAKQAVDAGASRVLGAFCQFEKAGTAPSAILFGMADASTGAGGLSGGTPGLTLSTSNSAGVASTGIRTDATIAAFDTTAPVTQAFGDSAAVGSAGVAARRDHKHGMPTTPTTPGVVMLADSLLGSDAANFDFTSIAGSYKHLQLIVQGRSAVAAINDNVAMIFNNDSGANYDYMEWTPGSGNTYTSAQIEAYGATSIVRIMTITGASSSAGDVGNATIWIPDYASTTFNKSAHAEGGVLYSRAAGNGRPMQAFGSWRSTAAITRITLTPAGGNWKAGSRATLYGYN